MQVWLVSHVWLNNLLLNYFLSLFLSFTLSFILFSLILCIQFCCHSSSCSLRRRLCLISTCGSLGLSLSSFYRAMYAFLSFSNKSSSSSSSEVCVAASIFPLRKGVDGDCDSVLLAPKNSLLTNFCGNWSPVFCF